MAKQTKKIRRNRLTDDVFQEKVGDLMYLVANNPGITMREINVALGDRWTSLPTLVGRQINRGELVRTGSGRSHRYWTPETHHARYANVGRKPKQPQMRPIPMDPHTPSPFAPRPGPSITVPGFLAVASLAVISAAAGAALAGVL